MNKKASSIRIANRHLLASINTPIIEEVLPHTFSRIRPEERTYITHKCMEALRDYLNLILYRLRIQSTILLKYLNLS